MAEILVVDDNIDACQPLTMLLRHLGYQSECVTSGEQALAKLDASMPDLLILDVMMPDMDGTEVLRRVRSNPRTANLPVIILSAVSDDRFRNHLLSKGATEYWVKASFDFTDLAKRVRRYVPARKAP